MNKLISVILPAVLLAMGGCLNGSPDRARLRDFERHLKQSGMTYSPFHLDSNGRIGLSLRSIGSTGLSPLKGMPVKYLDLGVLQTPVVDLSPLTGMKLYSLTLPGCGNVSNLSVLAGMPLRQLSIYSSSVEDLSPLKDTPMERLSLRGTRVTDISPLQEMPLTDLDISGTLVKDLSPIGEMKTLRILALGMWTADLLLAGERYCAPVTDLSPLKNVPLEALTFVPENITKGMDELRQMETLKLINDLSPKEFWRRFDAGEFRGKRVAEPPAGGAGKPAPQP